MHQKSLYTDILNSEKYSVIHPFGACLMASDTKLVENVEGERGSPWVFPSDPSQIKIKDMGNANVACFIAYGSTPPPEANVWFYFVPDRSGMWEFSAILAFHGFYILKSDDSWYNCRSAWVKLTANVQVYQYSWQGKKNFTFLDRKESNANYTKLYDSTEWLDTKAVLRAGDGAWIKVNLRVEGSSRGGGGTWGELNFQEGSGNYILPLITTARFT